MEIQSNIPELTQKQIVQQLCYSDSTVKRYRDQINLAGAYNRNTTKRKKMSSQDGSITVKGQNCEDENEIFSRNDLVDRVYLMNDLMKF